MVEQADLVLMGLKALTVLLGMVVVYYGWRAYRKRPSRGIFWLTVAVLVLTIGAVSEGVATLGLGWDLARSHLFEAIVTLAGFVALAYALVAK